MALSLLRRPLCILCPCRQKLVPQACQDYSRGTEANTHDNDVARSAAGTRLWGGTVALLSGFGRLGWRLARVKVGLLEGARVCDVCIQGHASSSAQWHLELVQYQPCCITACSSPFRHSTEVWSSLFLQLPCWALVPVWYKHTHDARAVYTWHARP